MMGKVMNVIKSSQNMTMVRLNGLKRFRGRGRQFLIYFVKGYGKVADRKGMMVEDMMNKEVTLMVLMPYPDGILGLVKETVIKARTMKTWGDTTEEELMRMAHMKQWS